MTVRSKTIFKTLIGSAALMGAAPLLAQTTAPAPAPAQPAAPAASASASSFTEAEIKQFANAAVEVTKVQSDASIPAADKQPKMLAALQASGLDPAKFNAIGEAAASDPALQQRIQAAASASAPAAAAPAAPAPAPAPAP